MSQGLERDALRAFLTALFPEIHPSYLLLWGTPSKRSVFCQEVTDTVLTQIRSWAEGENVYLGCGLRDQNYGPTERGRRETVMAIPGLWLDVDYAGESHKKPNLPRSIEVAQALIEDMGLPPSIVVHSGHGLQAWWLFKELWTFDNEAERTKAESLTKGWSNTLKTKCRALRLDVDQVGDLPRVMRLPGTWNRKAVPRKVELCLFEPQRRYDPSEFERYLLADEFQPKEDLPDIKWSFHLDAQAEPPAGKLTILMENDPLFKRSWLRARTDFQDQSQSAYDLSLATKALLAGWTAQETVNLLIAHRRTHHQEPKLRDDYYCRTLNRAARDKDIDERQRIIENLQQGHPLPSDIKDDKAELFAIFNQTLWPDGDHKITKLLKFTGEPNEYDIELDRRMYRLGTIDNLISQTQFQRTMADLAGIIPAKQKGKVWDTFAQRLLYMVETVDSGDESTARGAAESWVAQYLQGEKGDEERWEAAMNEGHPFRYNGRLWLTSAGFMRFVQGRLHERVTTTKLAQHLRKLGWLPDSISYRSAKDKTKVKHKKAWYRPGM